MAGITGEEYLKMTNFLRKRVSEGARASSRDAAIQDISSQGVYSSEGVKSIGGYSGNLYKSVLAYTLGKVNDAQTEARDKAVIEQQMSNTGIASGNIKTKRRSILNLNQDQNSLLNMTGA